MRQFLKRITAILLTCAMLLGMLPVYAVSDTISIDTVTYIKGVGISVYWSCTSNLSSNSYQIVAKDTDENVTVYNETRSQQNSSTQNCVIPDSDLTPGHEYKIWIKCFGPGNSVVAEGVEQYITVPEADFIEVDSPSNCEIDASDEENIYYISFSASARWEVSESVSWITNVSPSSGNAGSVSVQFTVRQNTGEERDADITIKLKNGNASEVVTVYQEGKSFDDYDRVAADRAALEIEFASGDNEDSVTSNLVLPTRGSEYGSSISWTSSDTSVVSSKGIVTRQSEDVGVTLTADIVYATGKTTKDFYLIVKGLDKPELDMSGAKLDKSEYIPGDTISISGIKVKNAVNVHFSGTLQSVGTKDVSVEATDSWQTVETVTMTIPSTENQYGDYRISVYAENEDGEKTEVDTTALLYGLVKESAAMPELDMSGAKLDKSEYIPGDTINISGIKVKNAVNVHFSGTLQSVGTKDVSVEVTDSWQTVETVTMTIPSTENQYGDYRISVYAENEDGEKTEIDTTTLLYGLVKESAAMPELDMSGAKLDKSEYIPGDTISISGIKVKNAVNVHFSGTLQSVGTKDVSVEATDSWQTVETVTMTIPSTENQYGDYRISVYAENEDGEKTEIDTATLLYGLVKESAAMPELDMSGAKLDKSEYIPGDTISISGIKVKNAVNVHFSGTLQSVGTKDVSVEATDSWETVETVILTIPSTENQYGDYRISVYAENEDGKETAVDITTLLYSLVQKVTIAPELDMSNAKLDKSNYNPGDIISISGIKVKNAVNVHFSGNLQSVGTKDRTVDESSEWQSVGTVTMKIPDYEVKYGTYYISVRAENENGKTEIDTVTLQYNLVQKTLVDTSSPLIEAISSAAGTTFVIGTETTFSTKVSDNAVLDRIEMYIDSILVETVEWDAETGDAVEISYTTKMLTVGSHTILVKAYDEAGNENRTSLVVTVTKLPAAGSLETPVVSSPAGVLYCGTNYTFTWNAVDHADTYLVEVSDSSGNLIREERVDDLRITLAFMQLGKYSISVCAESDEYETSEKGSIEIIIYCSGNWAEDSVPTNTGLYKQNGDNAKQHYVNPQYEQVCVNCGHTEYAYEFGNDYTTWYKRDHVYGKATYSSDADGHYQNSQTCVYCKYQKSAGTKTAHTYGQDNKCTVCGYVKVVSEIDTEYFIEYAVNGVWQNNENPYAEINVSTADMLIIEAHSRVNYENEANEFSDFYFSFINEAVFVTENGGNVLLNETGSNTIYLYRESIDEKYGTQVPLAALIVNVYDESYLCGWQLGYDEESSYYNSRIIISKDVKTKLSKLNVAEKQLWFELQLGDHLPIPTLAFEEFNRTTDWLWRQYVKSNRDIVIKLSDPLSNYNTISITKDTFNSLSKKTDYIISSIIDKDGLSNSDKEAMVQLLINYWMEQIRSGDIKVDGMNDVASHIAYVQKSWETSNYEKRYREVSKFAATLDAVPNGSFANFAVDTLVQFETETYLSYIEMVYAQLLIRAIRDESINMDGINPGIRALLEETLDDSSNVLYQVWTVGSDVTDVVTSRLVAMVIDELLSTASLGAVGIADSALQILLGDLADQYETLNHDISVLEGAIEVFITQTKPNFVASIEKYKIDPTKDNYLNLQKEANAYHVQACTVLNSYYSVLEKTEGVKTGTYAYKCKKDASAIESFLANVK